MELGSPERTDALAARLIAKDSETMEEVLRAIFAEQGETAAMLWEARRGEFPNEAHLATLRSVRRMLTAKPDAATLADLRLLAPRASRMPIMAVTGNVADMEDLRDAAPDDCWRWRRSSTAAATTLRRPAISA